MTRLPVTVLPGFLGTAVIGRALAILLAIARATFCSFAGRALSYSSGAAIVLACATAFLVAGLGRAAESWRGSEA